MTLYKKPCTDVLLDCQSVTLGPNMKVLCKCGETSFISRENQTEENAAELLCSCSDPTCGHTFVNSVAYKKTLKQSALHLGIGATFSNGRVTCGCGSNAVINKTNRLSIDCADMYCECKNESCEHQFVMSSYFSHSLSPSAKTTSELAVSLIRALPPQQRHELNQQLSMF